MRSAPEILEKFVSQENVHSIDPFVVYERLTKAAILAIQEAQLEALDEASKIVERSFEKLKTKNDDKA